MSKTFSLIISDLRIWVHLGCAEEERVHPQLVSINIELEFKNMPLALDTDNINDTICYLEISKSIQELCKSKHFNLIEHMSMKIHETVSKTLHSNKGLISSIKVSLHKVSPPVPGLHGGVYSVYSAEPKL